MARIIGTAGHVDHGKTTLIRALTGIDADRLPEEKSRGMTIDVGFAYLDLPEIGRISIVDVPGHEKFIRNMLVGAAQIDLALLCVAADDGVMPQTREHIQILDLLPVTYLVVAITRTDLADEAMRAYCLADIQSLLSETRFFAAPIVFVSAETGEGLPELKALFTSVLSAPSAPKLGLWYMPIDRVFTVKGHGTVVTGTLARGAVRVGETAVLSPGSISTKVRSIESHDESKELAESGARVALNLAGVSREKLERGMVVGAAGSSFDTTQMEAEVRWLTQPKHAARVRISIGAAERIGKVLFGKEPGPSVTIRLESECSVARDQPVIIRQYSPPILLGGGTVTVPASTRITKLKTIMPSDQEPILALVSAHPNGLSTEEICRQLGHSPQELGDDFERLKGESQLLGFAGLWLTPTSFTKCTELLLDALDSWHKEQPTAALIPRDRVIERAKLGWKGKPLDRLIAAMVEAGNIRASGPDIARSDFAVQLSPRQTELLDRVCAHMNSLGPNAPSVRDIAVAITVPIPAVQEIIRIGQHAARLVHVGEGIVYTTTELERIKNEVIRLGVQSPFTAAEIRDSLGTSRRYIIPLLEYFDKIKVTERRGEVRVLMQQPAT